MISVRVDGHAKVTGTARYAAEFSVPGLVYAALVMSAIPRGRVSGWEKAEAESLPGVIAVITPENALKLPHPPRRLTVLQDNEVFYNNQPVAIVLAETLHEAQHAASLVRPFYEAAAAKLDFQGGFESGYPSSDEEIPGDQSWGDGEAGMVRAEVVIDQIYTTPIHHHNPLETHATIAEWEGNHLNVYDSTQHIWGVKEQMAEIFGLSRDCVHVTCLFTGGGFGCKGELWSHVVLAALAAKQVKRPVKLVLERRQMFGPVGARPCTHQHLTLGATHEGRLTAIRHEVFTNTSVIGDYTESAAFPTRVMYGCPNVSTSTRLVQLNLGTPTYMRAPGVATGTFALEAAMDELAYEVNMDPLLLRHLNYASADPQTGKPFTSKHLRECYERGAKQFRWSERSHKPGSMRENGCLMGWGMATETYPGKHKPALALVRLQPNGRVLVASGTQEIGTGNYTMMTQLVSDIFQISPSVIDARLGDTKLPQAPMSAGSMSAASVLPAVKAAAEQARQRLFMMAVADEQSPFYQSAIQELEFSGGRVFLKSHPAKAESFEDILNRNGAQMVGATGHHPARELDLPCYSFGAIFVEVAVDAMLSCVEVRRVVARYDVGRVVHARMAESQFISGIVWGISLALHEETIIDWRLGRVLNANLTDYRVPVNADIENIDVMALDIPDYKMNSLGLRGVGEIGITGTAAAIANAVFHATGKRVRDLPITPEKLL